MKKLLNEFKTFAVQGNMLDLAVGLIIGTAFGTVVKSFVDDVIMPVIAWIFGQPDFSNLFIVLRNKTGQEFVSAEMAKSAGAVVLGYGNFLNALVAFVLSAFALFLIIKGINTMKQNFLDKKAKAEIDNPPQPTNQELLLMEIRDLLRK